MKEKLATAIVAFLTSSFEGQVILFASDLSSLKNFTIPFWFGFFFALTFPVTAILFTSPLFCVLCCIILFLYEVYVCGRTYSISAFLFCLGYFFCFSLYCNFSVCNQYKLKLLLLSQSTPPGFSSI